MRFIRLFGDRVRLGGLLLLLLMTCDVTQAQSWKTEATYQLENIGLSEFLAQHLGLQGVDDHGIDLGGIGSDLFYNRGAGGSGVYYMNTDRGANGEDPRTFPVEKFTPFILKVSTTNGKINILETIPITGIADATDGVTGIPNLDNTTEPPALNEPFFACNKTTRLATNPNGLDTEGLVRTQDGTFWIVEEYGPSLLKVDASGKVIKRFFPAGLLSYFTSPVTGYATDDSALSMPAIYGLKRKLNRGFEGITISPDEKTLYLALQSPLNNPTTTVGNNAIYTRILAFDIAKEQVVGEYVYKFQPADEFNHPPAITGNRPRDMKVSALSMLDQQRMLVLERTDFIAKIYLVDLRTATNILGTVWDDVNKPAPRLEEILDDTTLANNGVARLSKELVATLDSTEGYPQKIEGMAVLDGKTIAIANDNDFGVGSFTVN